MLEPRRHRNRFRFALTMLCSNQQVWSCDRTVNSAQVRNVDFCASEGTVGPAKVGTTRLSAVDVGGGKTFGLKSMTVSYGS